MEVQLIEIANMLAAYHKEIDSLEGIGDKGLCQLRHAKLIIDRFKEQPKKSIEERKNDFIHKLESLGTSCTSGINLFQFIDYWTEHGENAKKMRFEKEKVFDIKKRLERWNRNQKPTTNGTTTSEALNKFITE